MRNDELISKLTINQYNRVIINRQLGLELLDIINKVISEYSDDKSIMKNVIEDKTREEL